MGKTADGRLMKHNFITVSVYFLKSCAGLAFRVVRAGQQRAAAVVPGRPHVFTYCRRHSARLSCRELQRGQEGTTRCM